MPLFNTGNATWDQGLNTLGSSLFPDPSKVAQAGYYGAEARNAMLKGAQTQNQMAHQRWMELRSQNLTGPAPAENYVPAPGPNMPPIMQSPDQPAASQPPPPAPSAAPPATPPAGPPTLGQTVTGAPPQPPAAPPAVAPPGSPAVPPPGGLVGAGMSPASLSALVAQGGGAVGGQQPQVIGQGPSGGAIVQPTTTPQAAADNTPNLVAAHPNLTRGTPPAADSPAPNSGAPVTSNATASNGTVPQGQDSVSGAFHPGSVTDTNGGTKVTGPANADGSPAKPQFNLSHYIVMAAGAGMDANQVATQGAAYLASLYQKGIIDRDTYHQMLGGVNQPGLAEGDIQSKTQLGVAGINAGSAAAVANINAGSAANVANINQAGALKVAGVPTENIVDPEHPNLSTIMHRGDIPATGVKSFNPNAVSTAITPQLTQPGGPGTPVISQPTLQAQKEKSPIYQPTVGAEGDKPGTYIDPKKPTQLIPATFNQAQARGLVAAPTSMEGWTALAASASANEPDPAKAQAIRDKVMSFATAATPKATTPNESVQNSNINDMRLALQMPVPVRRGIFAGGKTNLAPGGASPVLETTLQQLTDEYYARSPDNSIRGNRVGAADAAIQQLIREGRIDPNQSRDVTGMPGSTAEGTIKKPVFNKQTGQIDQVDHFRVDLLDPKTKKVVPPGQAPVVHMTQPLSATVTASTPPAGALGPAPPNTPDGTVGTTSTGQRGVARGGWIFPAS